MDVLNINSKAGNKENRTVSPSKELQKMKIELNDKIFENHKLEEDFAQERAKLVINFQKERTNLNKTIKELKHKNESDNDQWTKKMDQMRKQKQEALKDLTNKYQCKLKAKDNKIKQDIEATFKQDIERLKNEVASMNNQLDRKSKEWSKAKQDAVHTLTVSFNKKEQEKNKKHHEQITKMKKQYEERMSQFQLLYMKEEKQKKKLQKDLAEKIKDSAKNSIILEGINSQITNQNEILKEKIIELETKIKQLNEHEACIQKMHEQQRKFVANNHLEQLSKVSELFEKEKQEMTDLHNKQIQQIRTEVLKMDIIYKEKDNLWDKRGKKLLQLYEKRQSKKEDVKAIEKLEVQLLKRDFMIEKERSELKYCKLELENMEEIYDKMFLSSAYLSKTKAKSFKVKKIKTTLMTGSNKSMIQNRRATLDDR